MANPTDLTPPSNNVEHATRNARTCDKKCKNVSSCDKKCDDAE